MKRRMASLPPISLETFNEKVLAAKDVSNKAAAKASYEKTCHTCSKAFYSEGSYQQHINSSNHKKRQASLRKDGDAASVQSSAFSLGEPVTKTVDGDNDVTKVTENLKSTTIDEQEEGSETEEDASKVEFSPARCLFCKTDSTDIHTNVDHMRRDHGMFIPEQKYLVDIDGLINYLFRKITENFECLYCHAIRNTAQAIRTHMRDKSHCMIAFDTEAEQVEIGQYYDFRGTYDDDEDESSPASGGVKVNGDGEDQGWETESSASDDEDDLDNYRGPVGAYEYDYELHLPSGKSVGHRANAKYFKQNLHNYLSPSEHAARQLAIENGEIDPNMGRVRTNHHRAITTRANGGMGMIGATEEQKETALTAERRERTRALKQENRYLARVEKANNHQKHFRVCLICFLVMPSQILTLFPGSPSAMITSPQPRRESTPIDRLSFSASSLRRHPRSSRQHIDTPTITTDLQLHACYSRASRLLDYWQPMGSWSSFDSTKIPPEVLFPSRGIFSNEFFNPAGFNEAS
jgi:pre-60S factor REI1